MRGNIEGNELIKERITDSGVFCFESQIRRLGNFRLVFAELAKALPNKVLFKNKTGEAYIILYSAKCKKIHGEIHSDRHVFQTVVKIYSD